MQAGVPVVASNIPGNVDLVLHDQTGRLVPLGDRADFARQTHDLLGKSADRQAIGRRRAGADRDRVYGREHGS